MERISQWIICLPPGRSPQVLIRHKIVPGICSRLREHKTFSPALQGGEDVTKKITSPAFRDDRILA